MGLADSLSSLPGASYGTSFLDAVLPRNPVTGARQLHILPESYEISWGKSKYYSTIDLHGGAMASDLQIVQTVSEIFSKLKSHTKRELPYEVTIVQSDFPNAMCLPGGKIIVGRGLLVKIREIAANPRQRSYQAPDGEMIQYDDIKEEDLIAALLAHEMTHADARHAVRRLENTVFFQILISSVNFVCETILGAKKRDLEVEESKPVSSEKLDSKKSEEEEKARQERSRQKNWIDTLQAVRQVVFYLLNEFGTKLYELAGRRQYEYEADLHGWHLAKRAGYEDHRAWLLLMDILKELSQESETPTFFENFKEFWSTHPRLSDRQSAIYKDYTKASETKDTND